MAYNKEQYRNDQRSTVKRPGTIEYRKDFYNHTNQFYSHRTTGPCKFCKGTRIEAQASRGFIIVRCANCHRVLLRLKTYKAKVGNWDRIIINRVRNGLCTKCGSSYYIGKMHMSLDRRKYDLQLECARCGFKIHWHN